LLLFHKIAVSEQLFEANIQTHRRPSSEEKKARLMTEIILVVLALTYIGGKLYNFFEQKNIFTISKTNLFSHTY
jgi:hypothetical protein